MKIDLDQLSKTFNSEDLPGLRDEISEIDLGDGFGFVSTALASTLVSTIDFMEQLVNLANETGTAGERKEDKALITNEISRNLLLARLLLTRYENDFLKPKFSDALDDIDAVFNSADLSEQGVFEYKPGAQAAVVNEVKTTFMPSDQIDHYMLGGTLLGFEPKDEGPYTNDDVVPLHFHEVDEFDMSGMLDVVNETLLSFEAQYDYPRNNDIGFELHVASSAEDMFEQFKIQKLRVPNITNPDHLEQLKQALAITVADYVNHNPALLQRIDSHFNINRLDDSFFVIAYSHKKDEATSDMKVASIGSDSDN